MLKIRLNDQKSKAGVRLFSDSSVPIFPKTALENQKLQSHIINTASISIELRTKRIAVTFEKSHYDMLQLVLNELTLWQPEGYVPPPSLVTTSQVASFACHLNCESVDIKLESSGNMYHATIDRPTCLIASQVDGKPAASYVYFECSTLNLIDHDQFVAITGSELPVTIPRLVVHSSACDNPEAKTREVYVAMCISAVTWNYRMGSMFTTELVNFFSTEPPEMVYPYSNRYTRLSLDFNDVSISYKPVNISEQAVLAIAKAEFTTNIVPTSSNSLSL